MERSEQTTSNDVELRSLDDHRVASAPESPQFDSPDDGLGQTLDETSGTTSNRQEFSLPPVDRGFGAWSFLAAAFILETVIWGFPGAFGVFLEAYLDDPLYANQKGSGTLLPLIGTLSSGIMYCSAPIIYPLSGKYPRSGPWALWIGATICVVSLLGASFTKQIISLVGLQGVGFSIGGSIIYGPTVNYMNQWFVSRVGLANGVISAGTAVGGLVLPLIFPPIIAKYGPDITLRYVSVATAAILVFVLPFMKPRIPASRVHIRGPSPRGARLKVPEWAKSSTFWLVLLIDFTQGFGYFVPMIYLPTFATELPLSATKAAITLSLLNGASVIGKIIMGILCDAYDPWILALTTISATSIASFVLWGALAHNFAWLCVFGIVFGGFAGGWPSLWTGFIQKIAGKEDSATLTTIFGFLMMFRGLGNILSTPVSAAFYAQGRDGFVKAKTGFEVGNGKFNKMIIFVGFCFAAASAVAAGGWAMELVIRNRQRRDSAH